MLPYYCVSLEQEFKILLSKYMKVFGCTTVLLCMSGTRVRNFALEVHEGVWLCYHVTVYLWNKSSKYCFGST